MQTHNFIQLPNGRIYKAEIHWYEAHGTGRKEYKRKRYLEFSTVHFEVKDQS